MNKKKKVSKALKKLYDFKAWLEAKIHKYAEVIAELKDEQLELNLNSLMNLNFENEFQYYSREIDDWQKLKNEAEVALVYIKIQIAFEEEN